MLFLDQLVLNSHIRWNKKQYAIKQNNVACFSFELQIYAYTIDNMIKNNQVVLSTLIHYCLKIEHSTCIIWLIIQARLLNSHHLTPTRKNESLKCILTGGGSSRACQSRPSYTKP
ncbi:hypothetical protein K501DRAFT_273084 [Backusella circina FSU 941]|nr:hypothetical protein K501DRAFT_273084 [Backusella circina FSU 941]